MVGAAGFEPTITGSKPDALPLGYAPKAPNLIYDTYIVGQIRSAYYRLRLENAIGFSDKITPFYAILYFRRNITLTVSLLSFIEKLLGVTVISM